MRDVSRRVQKSSQNKQTTKRVASSSTFFSGRTSHKNEREIPSEIRAAVPICARVFPATTGANSTSPRVSRSVSARMTTPVGGRHDSGGVRRAGLASPSLDHPQEVNRSGCQLRVLPCECTSWARCCAMAPTRKSADCRISRGKNRMQSSRDRADHRLRYQSSRPGGSQRPPYIVKGKRSGLPLHLRPDVAQGAHDATGDMCRTSRWHVGLLVDLRISAGGNTVRRFATCEPRDQRNVPDHLEVPAEN